MAVVLDSGVVVGFLDRQDALHGAADDVAGFFSGLLSAVLPVDVAVADRAADLRSRFKSLRMPDALILATAETDPDVDLLVTGDRQLTKVSGLTVEVRLLG